MKEKYKSGSRHFVSQKLYRLLFTNDNNRLERCVSEWQIGHFFNAYLFYQFHEDVKENMVVNNLVMIE